MTTSADLHRLSSDLDAVADSPARERFQPADGRPSEDAHAAATPEQRHPFLRFLDAFLAEENIKWILTVGLAILFGSSAMLVVNDWASFPPLGKFATLLAYTAAIYAAGELSYHRLGLRRTGTVLQVLTVLLIPVVFLALRWLPATEAAGFAAPLHVAAWLAAGGVGLVFSAFAARRIFAHFLRGHQPTFLAAYLLLALAGALPPGWALAWPLLHALGLWAVFTAGTLKVNRHVFWLVEEHRWPRICGFAPVAILGAQFVTLFVIQAAPRLATEWLGVACTLAAVPILLAADAVLGVFEQRTGGLVRPLPPAVVLPFYAGLAACAGGLCLSMTGGWPPLALVPAAAITAAALGFAAARTGQPVLVWLMLAAALVAYRFCPAYFQEITRLVVETGAAAVHEPRLPLAFYGLSFLPFVAGVTGISRWLERRGNRVFAAPMRRFAVGISALLLVLSFTHVKAVLPVAAALTIVFVSQARLYREPRLLWLAAVAFVAAAVGVTPFVERVLGWSMPVDGVFLCAGVAAAMLRWPGKWVEGRVAGRGNRAEQFAEPADVNRADGALRTTADRHAGGWMTFAHSSPLASASRITAVLLAAAWLLWAWTPAAATAPWFSPLLIAALLIGHALARPVAALSEVALVFPIAAGLMLAAREGATFSTLVSAAALAHLGVWAVGVLLRRRPQWRVSRTFAAPAFRVAIVALTGLGAYHAVMLLLASFGWIQPPSILSWVGGLLLTAWCFDAARRLTAPAAAWLGCGLALPVVSSGMLLVLGPEAARAWYPAAWAVLSTAGVGIARMLKPRSHAGAEARDSLECGDLSPLSFRGTDDRTSDAADANDAARKGKRRHVAALPMHGSLATIAGPMHCTALAVLVATAFGTLPVLGMELRVAGIVAAAGLLLAARLRPEPVLGSLGIAIANWQVLALVIQVCVPGAAHVLNLNYAEFSPAAIPLAAAAALSLSGTSLLGGRLTGIAREVLEVHRLGLRIAMAWALVAVLHTLPRDFAVLELLAVVSVFALLVIDELWAACRRQDEQRVWHAEALAATGAGYLALLGVIQVGHGTTMFALLGTALGLSAAAALATRGRATRIVERPFRRTATALPLATVGLGIVRHLTHADPDWLGFNSLALLLAAGFYFWLGLERRRKRYIVVAAGILNIALAMLWHDLTWSDPQFYMVPLGLSLLGLVELLKAEIPRELRTPLRYVGALTVLVSPTFHIVDGSWAHLFTLMLASVGITLAGIGLRIRALAYLGSGFLAADLIAMVVRGSLDHPNLLWITGLATGAAVIGLAAYCENHREALLSRLRELSARLEAWE